ncbi:MAG: hypothetical protein M1836_004391 [Candelina mexicana]|nr:MAG: hypothetical protein M1836_004391 [Candelina mexicana]
MVSIGGRVVNATNSDVINAGNSGEPSLPDSWQQGLGIFDLTTMEWKDRYDAGAPSYVTPNVVKAYYQKHGRNPASWTNDVVQTWFTESGLNHTRSKPSDVASPNSTSSFNPRVGSSGRNAGAIAGGTVGGVVALALIATLTFYLLRRRRSGAHSAVPMSDHVPSIQYCPGGMEAVHHPGEVPVTEDVPSELPSSERQTRSA